MALNAWTGNSAECSSDNSRIDSKAEPGKGSAFFLCTRTEERLLDAEKERLKKLAAARNARWYANRKARDPEFSVRLAAKSREYRALNPEKIAALNRKSYARRDVPLANAKARAYRAANPDKMAAQDRREYERHSDKIIARVKKWAKDNPDKKVAHIKTRRARAKGAAISDLTAAQWSEIKSQYFNRCYYYYCFIKPPSLDQDHKIPLSRGGNHTSSNIVPSCPTCNRRKSTKTAEEFITSLICTPSPGVLSVADTAASSPSVSVARFCSTPQEARCLAP